MTSMPTLMGLITKELKSCRQWVSLHLEKNEAILIRSNSVGIFVISCFFLKAKTHLILLYDTINLKKK